MNLKSKIHRISCFPYRHEGRSREILLALCSFLLLSQKVSPFPLSHIGRYTPYRHFERREKSSLHSALSCFLRKRFPLFRCLTYGAIPVCQKDPSASLGLTLREYRSLTLPIYFPCNNDTREAPSTFAALLFFMRRTTPLNPTT